MIEVKELVKKYGSHTAVDRLTFRVEKGQIYGFLGPNGAGKSTTMNMITGYLGATEGIITVNGYDIFEEPEAARRCIGYLPELPPLYMDMTPFEYLKFAAELKKIKRENRQKLIEEAMETTGITDVQDRLIKNLSKGYKQRVGLAQAILGYPEVIILDEPTVGLDPKQIIEIRDLIKDLSHKHTVILSSHILSEVSAICDHVLIISKGKLVASDSPENLAKTMQGTGKLELEVKGSKEQVMNIVGAIGQIEKIDVEEQADNGIIELTLEIAAGADIREELFYALAADKCPIYRMDMSKVSLEDVFLELTSAEEEEQEEVEEKEEQEYDSDL